MSVARTRGVIHVLALSLSVVFLALFAAKSATAETRESEYTFFLPATGEEFTVEDLAEYALRQPESDGSESAQPKLDPVVIRFCNAGFGDTRIGSVKTGERPGIALEVVSLTCGDESKGNVHIRSRHESQWQYYLDVYPFDSYWDDSMWFATAQSLKAPDPRLAMPRFGSNGTLCYSTPVQIKNPQGVVVETMHPSVVVSERNRIVITSIPTSNTPYCR